MAGYNAAINVVINNERSIGRVITKIEQVSTLLNRINDRPLNIFGKTSGIGGDIAAKQLKALADRIREVANSADDAAKKARLLGNTVASTASSADVYSTILDNVKLANGGLSRQNGEVKNLARAWALAEQQARDYAARLSSIRTDALKELGIDPQGDERKRQRAEENAELIRQGLLEDKISKQKAEQYYLSQRAARTEEKINATLQRRQRIQQTNQRLAEDLALGAGFPLLFGGGAGAVGGGIAGAFTGTGGGFGAQILLSALGGALDTAANKAVDFSKALREGGDAASALEDNLGRIDPELRSYISNLQSSGQTALAASEAQKELARQIGDENADAFIRAGERIERTNNSVQRLISSIIALGYRWNELTQQRTFFPAPDGERKDILELLPEQFRPEDTEEKARTLAAQDRIRNLRLELPLQQQLTELSGINRDNEADSYFQKQRAIAQQQASIENEKIYTNFVRGRLDPEQRSLETKLKNERLQRRLNEIDQQSAQFNDRKAKEAERAAERAGRTATRAAEKAQREAQRRQKEVSKSLEAGDSIIRSLEKEIAIKKARNPLDEELLRVKYETETVQIRIGELLNKQQQDKANELVQERELLALTEARAVASLRAAGLDASTLGRVDFFSRDQKDVPSFESGFGLDVLGRQDEVLQKFLDKYKQVGEVAQLTSELVTFGIRDMVAGTKTAEQVFADFLRNIADMLLKTAATMIAQYIALGIARAFATGQSPASYVKGVDLDANFFKYVPRLGFGGGMEAMSARANGGPVSTGTPYMVGERGPELFVPNNSGKIVPNHALGGGGVKVETINITVENTGESLSPKAQKQIAGQVQGIVLSTLANERRSGGML